MPTFSKIHYGFHSNTIKFIRILNEHVSILHYVTTQFCDSEGSLSVDIIKQPFFPTVVTHWLSIKNIKVSHAFINSLIKKMHLPFAKMQITSKHYLVIVDGVFKIRLIKI